MLNWDKTSKTDEQLVELSLKDANNYLYLMNRYETKLLHYIRRISNLTKEDAEDVLQETFVSVYENLADFDSSFKFSSWIYRITHNKTISYIRKINSRPKSADIENKEVLENLISSKEMELDIHTQILKEKLMEEINKLDIKYKSVLVLRFVEGKDYNEISDILKISLNTVGTLINRAKKILKEKLN